MIRRLRGVLADKQPPYLVIDVQGVGYELEASLATFCNLPEVGTEVTLYTHLAVREDAHILYGFSAMAERTLFRSLIKVSGIGAKLALLILSGMTVEAFARCVQEGDAAALTRLPGIGRKTAERLIIEMRDRMGEMTLGTAFMAGANRQIPAMIAAPRDDAISALVALGYKLPEATRMVQALEVEGLASEEIIRLALQAAIRK
jgi:Holliday junction DNA helicase RuvA